MSRYTEQPVSAPWCHCDACKPAVVQAVTALRVEPDGRGSRRGARTLGMYCRQHADEKLARLRSKKRRTRT